MLLIDNDLLDELCAEAAASPRRRKNRNFHPHNDFPAHRLLNAIQPDSYVPPHRHLDPNKDETFVVLRGRLGIVLFDDEGNVIRSVICGPGDATLGVDIPHGIWHSVIALEVDTVFLEAKSGPYAPTTPEERAGWAPAENEAIAAEYLAKLRRVFGL
jgi:cupin fold WbuC family metalloprotein